MDLTLGVMMVRSLDQIQMMLSPGPGRWVWPGDLDVGVSAYWGNQEGYMRKSSFQGLSHGRELRRALCSEGGSCRNVALRSTAEELSNRKITILLQAMADNHAKVRDDQIGPFSQGALNLVGDPKSEMTTEWPVGPLGAEKAKISMN